MLFGIYAGKSNVVMETDVRAWRDIEITLSSTSLLVNKPVVNGIFDAFEICNVSFILVLAYFNNFQPFVLHASFIQCKITPNTSAFTFYRSQI